MPIICVRGITRAHANLRSQGTAKHAIPWLQAVCRTRRDLDNLSRQVIPSDTSLAALRAIEIDVSPVGRVDSQRSRLDNHPVGATDFWVWEVPNGCLPRGYNDDALVGSHGSGIFLEDLGSKELQVLVNGGL